MVTTRILVAFEPGYHVYQSAIASALQKHRPHTTVMTAEPEEFETEMMRLDPHLVICSRPNNIPPNSKAAWVKFSLDPEQSTIICLNGEYSEADNPGFEELLSIVDETERRAQTKCNLEDC